MAANMEELATRTADGLAVTLRWSRSDDRLTVVVTDGRDGSVVELAARRDNALDVFYHPFAYASATAA
jgi:hypothetical protein